MLIILFRPIILIFLLAPILLAQERQSPIPLAFNPEPTNCETNSARFSSYANYFKTVAKKNESVIVAVARLGTRESSRELNRIRLYIVRATLIEDLGLREEDVVTAEGTSVRGYGRVDIYIAGILVDTLLVKRGKALCADCCHPEGRIYSYPGEKKNQ